MNLQQGQTDSFLGFLALHRTTTRDGYLGALLITNQQGVPVEFRCTHPVKPTTIQKPLYGSTLEPYVGVTLCGVPLLKSIKTKPSVLIVQEEFLLEVRPEIPCAVLLVRRAGEAIEIKSSDHFDGPGNRHRVECSSGRFQPIVLQAHPEFPDDLNCRQDLESVFTHLDLIEPFQRIGQAVEVLGKQDKRFQ